MFRLVFCNAENNNNCFHCTKNEVVRKTFRQYIRPNRAFTAEILNEKLLFFCSVLIIIIIVKTTDVQKSTCNKNQNSNVPFCFLHWYYIKVKIAKSLRHCLSIKICLHLRTPSACWAHWKKSFPLRISPVNVNKFAGNCGFGHVHWRNL